MEANNPATYQEIGEVINIDTNPQEKFKDSVILECDFAGKEEPQTVFLPLAYWVKARMERWCTEGAIIAVTFEHTIEGKTTFENSEGKLEYHTKTNKAKTGKVRKASKRMFAAALAEDIASTGKFEDVNAAQATIIAGILKG
jgi:hypothetical protein